MPGDVVLLGEGDIVPADGEVVEGSSLLVDESALTGESVPVAHRGRLGDEPGDELSGGTVVARGRAVLLITQTRARSALGRSTALTDVRPGPTPLQRRMAQLGRMLATVAVSLSALADAVHRAALQEAEALAGRGLRVLAVQAGPWEDGQRPPALLGLVAMDDPAKPAAVGTVAACRQAGIVPVLITGDHRATAVEVATRVGVLTAAEAEAADAVATGDQIARGRSRTSPGRGCSPVPARSRSSTSSRPGRRAVRWSR